MKTILSMLTILIATTVSADPTVTVTVDSHATTDLSGYTTYLINVESDDNLAITSVGMKLETSGTMEMNQIKLGGLDIIFDSYDPFWAPMGEEKDQDSLFLFDHNNLTVVGGSSDGAAKESDTLLQAYFTGTNFLDADIVQIVLENGDWASYDGEVVIDDNGVLYEIEISGTIGN